jgi:hypothetical protein
MIHFTLFESNQQEMGCESSSAASKHVGMKKLLGLLLEHPDLHGPGVVAVAGLDGEINVDGLVSVLVVVLLISSSSDTVDSRAPSPNRGPHYSFFLMKVPTAPPGESEREMQSNMHFLGWWNQQSY